MKIIDFPQGSLEWALARAGRVTASRVDAVLSRARDRKSEGTTRQKYKAQLVSEILTGAPQENAFSSRAMDDGIENEPFASAMYEAKRLVPVDVVGFVVHPKLERSGCSPDGLIGTDGMVQFKCPEPHTHLGYVLEGVVPTDYAPQMHWEMACTGRAWSDFVSYSSMFPAPHNLLIVRLQRNEAEIQRITAEVTQFNREVDEIIEKLTGRPADEYLARLNLKEAVL